MPSIGPVSFATFSDDSALGTVAWSNPGNAAVVGGGSASASNSSSATTHYLKGLNASSALSAISDVDIIDGIAITVTRSAGLDNFANITTDDTLRLVIGGVVSGTNEADSATHWPTSAAAVTYGGATDTWGLTGLTGANVKASNFGVVLAADLFHQSGFSGTPSANVDAITLTVYYHLGITLKTATESSTITSTESSAITTTASTSDSGTVAATETSALQQGYTASDSGTLSAVDTSSLLIIHPVTGSDSGTMTGSEGTTGIAANVNTVETATLSATEIPAIDADTATSDSGTLTATETPSIAADVTTNDAGTLTGTEGTPQIAQRVSDSGTLSAVESSIRKIIEITNQQRLRIDITDKDGVPVGFGPLVNVIHAEYAFALDEVGTFTLTVPATLENTQYYQTGHRVAITREGEGLVFAGIIDHPEFTIDADNQQLMQLTGDSKARVLVWGNTLLARTYSNVAIADVTDDLLTGTGWTAGTVDSSAMITARYDGASLWAALTNAAASLGLHLRENALTETVDVVNAGTESGLVIRNLAAVVPGVDELAVLPLTSIHIVENQSDLWNRIIPLGSGVANNALTLEHATLSTPYPIQTMTGPDGHPIYYIEDTDSQTRYAVRTNVMKVDSVAPIANSTAEIENAANTLYQIAAAYLGWHAMQRDTYEVKTVGLRHVDPITGAPRFQVGQTIRLQYRGIVENERGRYVWKDVDDDLYLMKATREFQANGSDSWTLTLATVDQLGDDNPVTKAINAMWAIQTALKPYTYMDSSGPTRQTADSSHNFEMDVTYDDNVTYIHRAILQVTKRTIRSNVAGAAGGGSHSHTIGGSTSGSGGGQTSSGGTAHNHSVGSHTSVASGDLQHNHAFGIGTATSTWTTPAFMQQIIVQDPSGDYGFYVGRNGTQATDRIIHTPMNIISLDHSHAINSTTSTSESSHTHSVSNHTHSISGSTSSTVTSHTHSMTYGIFEGPAASTPQMHVLINGVDVTATLGGPWNGDFTVDVTAFLTDLNGLLLRQSNSIEISTEQLLDLEVVVKSLLSAQAVVPV